MPELKNVIKRGVTLFLLLLGAILTNGLAAQSYSSGRISLNVKNTPLPAVLKQIEKQTDYRFSYKQENLSQAENVTIKCKDETLQNVLTKVFENSPLTYEIISNNTVIIIERKQTATTSQSAKPEPNSSQSKKNITGVVVDEEGEPLIGATLKSVNNPSVITVTDIDGNYFLRNVAEGDEITISFIGFAPYTFKIGKADNYNAILQMISNNLDEVLVVGFGVQKKVNLTGAVSSISSNDIANRPIASATDALQGLAPGLEVLSSNLGGQLNGTRSINIRGTGTIGTGSEVNPLVLIDGMEGDLNTINPQDIENISVLKDASASSIYGSRAAGGVILVTTKNGKEGKIKVNYSDSFRWSHIAGLPAMMDSYNWGNYMNQASVNSGNGVWIPDWKLAEFKAAIANPSLVTMFPNEEGRWDVWGDASLMSTASTDWLKEHFGKTSFSQEHNISVTGGSERINAYFSANLLDQGGLMRYGDDNRQRYNLTGRINLKINNWLLFGYSTRWNRINYDSPSIISSESENVLYHNFIRYWPNFPVYDPNGHPVLESYVEALTNGGRYKTSSDRLDQQFSFLITPFKGFSLNADFNYRSIHENVNQACLQLYGWNVDGSAFAENNDDYPAGTQGSFVFNSNNRANYFNPNVYATYEWTINNDNEFKVMAGFQSEWYKYHSFWAERTGVINNLPYLDTTDGIGQLGGGSGVWTTAGWFGRINYNYKGRYLVEGNIRYDGTSRFRSGHRWAVSPSFSLGWNLANESWFDDMRQNVNTLKLRYSWGKLGNQNTNNWYPTYANMGYYPDAKDWLIYGNKPTYATMPGLISSKLTWEQNRTWDIGIDWGFFNNRLTGSFDYYNRRTKDMVGPGQRMSGVLGATVPNTNNLSMTSKGWELSISWRDRINDFTYGITANLYDHTVTIDEYPNPGYNLDLYYPGAKLGDIWGLTTVGIAKTQAEMDEHLAKVDQSQLGYSWTAGDIMYADIDGNGVIDDGEWTLQNHGDYKVIGNTTPRYNFGLILDAQWKGFDLRVYFAGVGKRDYWADNAMFWGAVGQGKWQATGFMEQLDYFRAADTTDPLGPNVNSYYPAPNWGGYRNTYVQTRYLQNAAYCALKNITIGYTIPKSVTMKAHIENLRIFVSGENLAKITNFTKLGDPEMIDAYDQAYGSWNLGGGFGKIYPMSRVFSFGVNVTF